MATISRYRAVAAPLALILACLSLCALIAAPTALAQPNTFDPSYGVGGLAITGTATNTNGGGPFGGFAYLPDGSTFLGSFQPGATNGDTDYFTVTRLKPDGNPDPGFGPNGAWTDYFGGTNSGLHAIAVTPNESVFGVGYNSGYLSAFFHKGGASSFYPNPNLCEAFAATTQANNQPIAVGQCGSTPVVTRYVGVPGNGFGFDPAFNGGAAQSAGGTTGSFNAAAVDSAGRIVAVGIREYPSTPDDYLIVRYLANGALDPAFHDEENLPGRVSEPIFEHNDTALSVAIQPDGKIVVAGYSNSLTSSAGLATIARFNTDGSIDGSFGTAGKLVFHFGSGDAPIYGLAVQPNGKIVFVGSQYDSVAQKDSSLIGRLLSNGSFDESFAPGGILVGIPGSSESRAIGVGVLPDGKILVGELLGGSGHPVPAVVRLIGNDPIPATATILTPSKSKIKRKKFAKVTGAASGDGLAKVELAILKSDKKLLKKKRRCLQVSGKSKLTKVKAVKKKCVISKWLPVTGTAGWIFKLSKKLPAGKYTIYARATGSTGVQVTPTKKSLTLIK